MLQNAFLFAIIEKIKRRRNFIWKIPSASRWADPLGQAHARAPAPCPTVAEPDRRVATSNRPLWAVLLASRVFKAVREHLPLLHSPHSLHFLLLRLARSSRAAAALRVAMPFCQRRTPPPRPLSPLRLTCSSAFTARPRRAIRSSYRKVGGAICNTQKS
jgi:hypothetical protein